MSPCVIIRSALDDTIYVPRFNNDLTLMSIFDFAELSCVAFVSGANVSIGIFIVNQRLPVAYLVII